MPGTGPDQHGHIPFGGVAGDQIVQPGQQADAPDGGGGQDTGAVCFIVQADIARHDGEAERAAGLANSFDRAHQLPHDLGLFRIAEVQVVGRGQRARAHRHQVAPGFGHGLLAAFDRVRLDVARGHIAGKGQRLGRAVDADHTRAKARRADRVGHDHAVILLPHPGLVGVAGRSDQGAQPRDGIYFGHRPQRGGFRRCHPGAVIRRCIARQRLQRQVGLHLIAQHHQEAVLGNCFADDGEIEIPFFEDRAGFRFFLGLEHHQHPFLGFRQHHFIGGHAGFAHRHAVKVQADAQIALVTHLYRRTGQTGRPHILNRDHRSRGHQFKAGLQQALFGEGIADLHGWALFLDGIVEFGACHGGSAHAVAPGLGAQIHHRHPHARGGGIEDGIGLRQTGGKGVHQAIAVIGAVKPHLAAHGRHAKGIAVAADPLDHALDQMRGPGMRRRAEAERIHRRYGARAHGEDIAQDAADAGRRPLMRLDEAGVVVAFHLEDHGLTIADIDHARVLARPADHLWSGGGQGAQPFL